MSVVGILPNPASGKDIRRLVAKAFVVSNQEKVNIVSRMLEGLLSAGVSRIEIMPDRFGIGMQALHNLHGQPPAVSSRVEILEMELENSSADSMHAAKLMKNNGVGIMIVLGGDGTSRVVSKVSGDVPLLPVSTGTNNVLPSFIEGTIAGLCAGYVAHLEESQRRALCSQIKRIEIRVNGELVDVALVDVAISKGGFPGSRAVWDSTEISQIAVTRASPVHIGLSAIVGMVQPVSDTDEYGVIMKTSGGFRGGRVVQVPLSPGLIEDVTIVDSTIMEFGQAYPVIDERPLVIALDGERELVLNEGDVAEMVLTRNGPLILDVNRAMEQASRTGFFVTG
ncbi:MAG: NAD(+)/NADH kinase [Anaerolineales bacterium]|nr:NAD(+)/NADH kinase [Anaerolineales bacterium]